MAKENGVQRSDWVEIFEALGEAFLAVARSEWQLLQALWKKSFKYLGVAIGLFIVALCMLLVLCALCVVLAVMTVEALSENISYFEATFYVALGTLVLIAGLAGAGYLILTKKFDNPVAAARTRLDDHLNWWRASILQDDRALPGGEADGPQKESNTGGSSGGAATTPAGS